MGPLGDDGPEQAEDSYVGRALCAVEEEKGALARELAAAQERERTLTEEREAVGGSMSCWTAAAGSGWSAGERISWCAPTPRPSGGGRADTPAGRRATPAISAPAPAEASGCVMTEIMLQ